MTQEQAEKLLRLHVSNDDLRPRMKVPYRQGDFFFATNGTSLAIIPVSAFPELTFAEDEKAPNCLKVIPAERHDPITYNIRRLHELVQSAPKIPLRIQCSTCGGDGYLECNLGHEHECEECNDGYLDSGDKVEPDPDQVFVINGIAWRVEILDLIIRSASIVGCENISLIWSKPEKPCLFEMDGINLLFSPAIQVNKQENIPDYITVTEF